LAFVATPLGIGCVQLSHGAPCAHALARDGTCKVQIHPSGTSHPKKSWITTEHFKTWFEKEFVPHVKAYLEANNLPPKAILLLDNAPTHSDMICDGIQTYFLPPKTTSIIQPLDNGVFKWFKSHYWHDAASQCMQETKAEAGKQALWFQSMTIRTALQLIQNLMDKMTSEESIRITRNCWTSALGLTDELSDEQYLQKLQHRLPEGNIISEILASSAAKALLAHVEMLEREDALQDQNEQSEEVVERHVPDEKLENLRELLKTFGQHSEVRKLLEETLELGDD